DGDWDILVQSADGQLIVPGYDHGRLSEIDDRKHVFGSKSYCFSTAGYDTPILTAAAVLKLAEHGRVQRRVLRGVYYPLQAKRPIKDAVVFISWKGKQCG